MQVEADQFGSEVFDIEHVDDGLPQHEATAHNSDECSDELLLPAAGGGERHGDEQKGDLDQVEVGLDDHKGVLEVAVERIVLDVEVVGREEGEEVAVEHGARAEEDVAGVVDDHERGEHQPEAERQGDQHIILLKATIHWWT